MALSGINNVHTELSSLAYLTLTPEPVYIVERFDRFDPSGKPLGQAAADLDSLAQAVALCRSKTAARLQLFRWLLFNVLVGNSDTCRQLG